MDEIQKKMASSRILAIVGEYEKERVEARRLPTHILLTELKNRAKFDHADILEALGDLEAKGVHRDRKDYQRHLYPTEEMSDQVNAVLTAKDVEGIRERMKRIQALSKGDLRIYEHCRQVGQTMNKGQRKVERAEKKVQSLKSHAIMSEEIKTEAVAQVEVKGPEKLEEAVKAHLDGMAAGDPGFAEKLKNPKKSLKECIEYIKGEVFHSYVAKNHGNVEIAAPSRAEVFGMAVHYYDEENVEIRKIGGGRPVNQPALSEEEKEKIKKAAEDKYAAQCIEDLKKREAEKKKKEQERKRLEREKAEAARKAAGEFSLFDLMGV